MSYSVNFSSLGNLTKSEITHKLFEKHAGYALLLATTAVVGAVAFACFAFFSSVSAVAVGIFIGMEIINITATLYFINHADNLQIQSDAYDMEARRKVATYLIVGTIAFVLFIAIGEAIESGMKR